MAICRLPFGDLNAGFIKDAIAELLLERLKLLLKPFASRAEVLQKFASVAVA
jgi:hypothetical protein